MDEKPRKKYTEKEWREEGNRRFGTDWMKWRFTCPSCGHVATPQDYKDAGAQANAVAFSCVGRWSLGDKASDAFYKGKGPCNYAGGGLIRLNPVRVVTEKGEEQVFDFA